MTTDAAPEVDRLAQRADPAGTTPAARTTEPWHRHGGGPDPTADGPVVHRWRKVAGRTLSKAWDDSLFGISSQAAFWSAMSTAPLLLALLGLVGPVAEFFGPETIITVQEQLERFLRTIFSPEVADNLLGETVETILDSTKSGVISVGLVISFWAGSSAISARTSSSVRSLLLSLTTITS